MGAVCMDYLQGQKKASEPLILELQTTVSHMCVLGLEPRSSKKAASVLIH